VAGWQNADLPSFSSSSEMRKLNFPSHTSETVVVCYTQEKRLSEIIKKPATLTKLVKGKVKIQVQVCSLQ
jgi:hypothetical protein